MTLANERTTNWAAIPAPSAGWARSVHPELEPAAALARLEGELEAVLRLEGPDPAAAWRRRAEELRTVASRLDALGVEALRFRGPGTELEVGLLPSSRFRTAAETSVDGVPHLTNLPSEEVFTAPDPARVDGHATLTRPVQLRGLVVRGARLEFRGGKLVGVEAESNAAALRALAATDPGAGRLGEVALVDAGSRVAPLRTVFFDTLVDENAASHIAIGQAYEATVEPGDRCRINRSGVHLDLMLGGEEVEVDAVRKDGTTAPLLRRGRWAFD